MVVLIGFILYFSVSNVVLDETLSSTSMAVEKSGTYIESYIDKMKDTTYLIAKDPSTVRYLSEEDGESVDYDGITAMIQNALEVDDYGLDEMDKAIILTIIEKFKGGPVGLGTLATAVSEERDTLEEVYEPYLIKEGYLMRSPRGRIATEKAYIHLGLEKGFNQQKLF